MTEVKEDGRFERSKRNRQSIIDAMIKLIGEGIYIPTAQQVADEAGITIRTVFRHFSEMDLLYKEIDDFCKPTYEKLFIFEEFSESLNDRVHELIDACINAYVELFHLEKATHVLMWRSEVIQSTYKRNQILIRKTLLKILPELKDSQKPYAIEIADAITSFEYFERLYSFQDLSVEDCKTILRNRMIELVSEQ
ncbi:TetR/AcrR family transcriptional regulator [Glaciecola petra]|uniref:TetR/AcrR family transcriptional regulator n=1 Tax=Glaciecola petra TaxID=3075602 RepID=A0ABU2ZUY8_9ALTE|nr:TetR/AcrR family transcriptional regulator [Aestuariibacter sp. P117]MDT0596459.1 TetR/AcrR family transcriptional regulator [Aestuariibacter sp. P117]